MLSSTALWCCFSLAAVSISVLCQSEGTVCDGPGDCQAASCDSVVDGIAFSRFSGYVSDIENQPQTIICTLSREMLFIEIILYQDVEG